MDHSLGADHAVGDRLLFTKNDHVFGVKNGILGTVIEAKKNTLSIALDSVNKTKEPSKVTFHINDGDSITLGYTQIIHKSQGATVDKSFGNVAFKLITKAICTLHDGDLPCHPKRAS